MKVTVLGCGTSSGVPRAPLDWGVCDPLEPRNRRRRPSILVQSETTTLVVDTGPDFREQMLAAHVERLDAVIYTHDHADHTHGLDDLRGYYRAQGAEIPCYGAPETLAGLTRRFAYAFEPKRGYPAIARAVPLSLSAPVTIGDIEIVAFVQDHGPIQSLGLRIGDFAYSTDACALPAASFETLAGVRTWIVDCVQEKPHPSHAHLARTLDWIATVAPERAYLTHLSQWLDYASLMAQLPPGVEPAYDGLVLEI
ncbi:MBL fold metallo-hydrolase [Rhodothalassium salexigens]|uniref:MBL fold metallo-hydrolase n=1 Tax=Rhodothalassium salexigens TaxID=1086 RepID=UPI0019127BDC|nr:MBL fold metallo-hydrolase [Rhodothalassium salexigens]MBK5911882.1 MBL fold metallo-hydrolase [Rhodothalassium salexigens]